MLYICQLKGLSEVEEMLISPVIPLMSIYHLCCGQYGYSGHVINLPQDIPLFISSLPRQPFDLDIVILRKEGSGCNHRNFCVRSTKALDSSWRQTMYTLTILQLITIIYRFYLKMTTLQIY